MQIDIASALLATLSAVFFAVEISLIRKSTVKGEPIDAAMITMWINLLIFAPLALFYYPDFGLNIKTILAFTAAGIFGSFLARICLYEGTKRVGASKSSPILKGDLLIASLVGLIILEEPITTGHISGILVLLAGVILVSYEMEKEKTGSNWKPKIGLLYPFGAMIFSGLSRPFAKVGLSAGTPVIAGLTVKFFVATAILSTYYIKKGNSPLAPFKARGRNYFIGAGIATSIGMWLIYSALRSSRVVVVMPFWSLSPLFVLVISYFFLKRLESISGKLILGTILVIIGATLTGIFM